MAQKHLARGVTIDKSENGAIYIKFVNSADEQVGNGIEMQNELAVALWLALTGIFGKEEPLPDMTAPN